MEREAASVFEEQLWDIVDERITRLVPLYAQMVEGSMPREAVAHWAGQVYLFVREFKRFLSAIHSNCDEPEAELFIIENLWEEAGEGKPGRDHPSLMRRLVVALGTPAERVDRLEPDPATRSTLDYFHGLCRQAWWVEALAAVGIGVEGSPLAREGREGPPLAELAAMILKDRYGLADEDVEFFSLHLHDDVEHSRRTMEIIRRHARTPEARERIMDRVREAAERITAWMEGVREAALALS